jgi:hypothetical protein
MSDTLTQFRRVHAPTPHIPEFGRGPHQQVVPPDGVFGVDRRFVSYAVRTMTTRAAILSHLHKVRVQGYALDDEEYVQDVRCVAAPILNHNGEVVASVGVSSLASRLGGERLPRVVAAVRKTASAISGALGGPRQDLSRAERPVRTGARPPASAAHRAQRRGSAAFSASRRKEDGSG